MHTRQCRAARTCEPSGRQPCEPESRIAFSMEFPSISGPDRSVAGAGDAMTACDPRPRRRRAPTVHAARVTWGCLAAALLLAAGGGRAQEYPSPTDAGRQGLQQLLRALEDGGGLAVARTPGRPDGPRALRDRAKAAAVLADRRAALTPAARDALLDEWKRASADDRAALAELLRLFA